MTPLLAATLDHLRELVLFDTRNPPRAINTGGIFAYLRNRLTGFKCETDDHGAGAVSLLAIRGKPKILFNVHLDTVPAAPTWQRDPFQLAIDQQRAVGLGACDIKGAAAGLIAAAEKTNGDAAFLFTSDEEANDTRCVAAFLERGLKFDSVIVSEPTRCEAVLAHRGISSVFVRFAGQAGHASSAASNSAVHQAMRWGTKALSFAESLSHERFGGLTGLRFNVGRIEGGIKANVIAPSAEVRFGFRPLPSMDSNDLLSEFRACAETDVAEITETFRGPSLPSGDIAQAESRRLAARDAADALNIPIGSAVDFWTEASLFSAAGYTTFVYGPGDIEQAHSADEFVELSQLQEAAETYARIIGGKIKNGRA
ncbi:MAG TPA: acetylornithine deacetylase [Rudaea sp.]|jgi:acetylornithine deacetylase|nr:acetylornithine deacetylase [Rudaea sp.]